MDSSESKWHWRARTLRAIRRHARIMEAQLHRLYAMLARLEADQEDEVADLLVQNLDAPGDAFDPFDPFARDLPLDGEDPFDPPTKPPSRGNASAPRSGPGATLRATVEAGAAVEIPIAPVDPAPPVSLGMSAPVVTQFTSDLAPRRRRGAARPVFVSFGVHLILLLICLPLSYATLTNQNLFVLLASPPTVVETIPEVATFDVETTADEPLLDAALPPSETMNLSDHLFENLTPLDSVSEEASEFATGEIDGIPSDLGTLMAGVGKRDGGEVGGTDGSAMFFGTKSIGDRFVFIVDNSDSMRDGRLDAALAELRRCVEQMGRRQSFYVIFVSDRLYLMFYPEVAAELVPATDANKRLLSTWLTRVQTAPGKNRELTKAIDLAASLAPDAVYFLWDGRIDSGAVRRDVMNHLARPNYWRFPVHAIGLGVNSRDSASNLSAIALASGGTYQKIDLPPEPK